MNKQNTELTTQLNDLEASIKQLRTTNYELTQKITLLEDQQITTSSPVEDPAPLRAPSDNDEADDEQEEENDILPANQILMEYEQLKDQYSKLNDEYQHLRDENNENLHRIDEFELKTNELSSQIDNT